MKKFKSFKTKKEEGKVKAFWGGLSLWKKVGIGACAALLVVGGVGTAVAVGKMNSMPEPKNVAKVGIVESSKESKKTEDEKKKELEKLNKEREEAEKKAKEAEKAIKEEEEKKAKLEDNLAKASSEEDKKEIKKEIEKVNNNIKKETEKRQSYVKVAESKKAKASAVATKPSTSTTKPSTSTTTPKPSESTGGTTTTKPVEKPEDKPKEPTIPVDKSKDPVKPVVTVVSTNTESKSENKDYVNYSYDTVNDASKAKGTSGISKEGTQGYTVYNYTRTVTKYSDGTTKTSDWSVASKNVVAPVNGVKWVGTYEEPIKTGYINNQVAKETAIAVNNARKANGLPELQYTLVGKIAEDAYVTSWSKYGLGHIGYTGECVAFWSTGKETVDLWMSDGHRNSLLSEYANSFSVGVYTDPDGVSWTIFFLK